MFLLLLLFVVVFLFLVGEECFYKAPLTNIFPLISLVLLKLEQPEILAVSRSDKNI